MLRQDLDSLRSRVVEIVERARVAAARRLLRRRDGTWLDMDGVGRRSTDGRAQSSRRVAPGNDGRSPEGLPRGSAQEDPLTGLGNRLFFCDRVRQALVRHEAGGASHGVIVVDVDAFTSVNDRLGHAFGDLLLQSAAKRLARCLRPTDTVARLGGDTFAILAADLTSRDDIHVVAQRVRAVFADQFSIEGRRVAVSASLGVAVAEPSTNAEALLTNAHVALRRAQAEGLAQTAIYESMVDASAVDTQSPAA